MFNNTRSSRWKLFFPPEVIFLLRTLNQIDKKVLCSGGMPSLDVELNSNKLQYSVPLPKLLSHCQSLIHLFNQSFNQSVVLFSINLIYVILCSSVFFFACRYACVITRMHVWLSCYRQFINLLNTRYSDSSKWLAVFDCWQNFFQLFTSFFSFIVPLILFFPLFLCFLCILLYFIAFFLFFAFLSFPIISSFHLFFGRFCSFFIFISALFVLSAVYFSTS